MCPNEKQKQPEVTVSPKNTMYYHNPNSDGDQGNLRVLEEASEAPLDAYESDDQVRAAFDAELRKLAEDIVRHHPSLTQLLLSLGAEEATGPAASPVHGQN